jgi:hypothetical protein
MPEIPPAPRTDWLSRFPGLGRLRTPDDGVEPAERADARARALGALLSLAVASVLWFTFSMRETYTVAVEVPIRVARVPDGQALAQQPPRAARLQLQGEGWSLFALRRNPPPIELRADAATVNVAQAAAEGSRLPSGVVVLGASPETVRLVLDGRVTRVLPISLVGAIDTPPPYGLLGRPRLRPDSVRVTGARRVLDGMTAWPTRPLVLDDLRDSRTVYVPLSDTLNGLVARSTDRVTVALDVEQFTEGERMLTVEVRGVPPGVTAVRLLPARVRATYLVPVAADYYDRAAQSTDVTAYVEYADIVRDTSLGTVPVRVLFPPDLPVRDVSVSPRRLEYFTVRESGSPVIGEP